jgi:hypothetical protein
MRRFFLKLRRRRNLDRELEAELAFHREMAQAAGNTIPLGNTLLIKETSGDPWRFTFIESLWRDVVYGIRGLLRNPTLVVIAVISLALGIGSSTAVFSIVNAVLLKPVPVPDPDRFVMLFTTSFSPLGVSVLRPGSSAVFDYWRIQSNVLQSQRDELHGGDFQRDDSERLQRGAVVNHADVGGFLPLLGHADPDGTRFYAGGRRPRRSACDRDQRRCLAPAFRERSPDPE